MALAVALVVSTHSGSTARRELTPVQQLVPQHGPTELERLSDDDVNRWTGVSNRDRQRKAWHRKLPSFCKTCCEVVSPPRTPYGFSLWDSTAVKWALDNRNTEWATHCAKRLFNNGPGVKPNPLEARRLNRKCCAGVVGRNAGMSSPKGKEASQKCLAWWGKPAKTGLFRGQLKDSRGTPLTRHDVAKATGSMNVQAGSCHTNCAPNRLSSGCHHAIHGSGSY